MPTLNYTTKISVSQTAGEIQQLLGERGAGAIMIRYSGGQPSAISFTLPHVAGADRVFTLPVDAAAMGASLRAQHHRGELTSNAVPRRILLTDEHAAKVAWRVVKDWLLAQLALVEAGQAKLDQVMLPYMHVDGEITLYQAYQEHGRLALGGASS